MSEIFDSKVFDKAVSLVGSMNMFDSYKKEDGQDVWYMYYIILGAESCIDIVFNQEKKMFFIYDNWSNANRWVDALGMDENDMARCFYDAIADIFKNNIDYSLKLYKSIMLGEMGK